MQTDRAPTPAEMRLDRATPRPWRDGLTDETAIIASGEFVATTFQDPEDYRDNYERRAADASLIVKAVNAHDDAFSALRESYVALAFAFQRIEPSARSRDGELCRSFQKVRAKIESVFRDAGECL